MEDHSDINLSILFVDDEANILSALRRELREWAKLKKVTIETANSGPEALEILEKRGREFAVVVSDLRMPVMKGSDLIIAIHEKWPDIVALLLSGYAEIEEVMRAVKAGAFSYLLKPWEGEYLCGELDKAFETYRIRAENRQHQARLLDELRWAGEMQKALLRPVPLRSDGVEFRSSYRPVPGLFCGGDYYDVISIGKDRYLILVGDVSGHGVRGAFVTAILKSTIYPEYIRNHHGPNFSPAEFLAWLNDRMNFELRQASGMLIAFEAMVLDRQSLMLTYANAGLPHPFILRGRTPVELPISGSAIGFAKSVMYKEMTEPLIPGDTILAFTDGLIEIQVADGSCRDVSTLSILNGIQTGPDLHKRILEKALIDSHAKDFSDDVTLLSAHIL